MQVFIYVGGVDGVVALAVFVLEEFVTGDVLTASNDAGEAPIREIDSVFDSAFPLKIEGDGGSIHAYMPVPHGGETEGMVFARVFLVAYPDQCGLHKAHYGGQHFPARHIRQCEVALHLLSNCRESGAEGEHSFIFGFIANLTPFRVIASLLSAFCVAARCLHVSSGIGTYPNVLPCGRNDKGFDSGKCLSVLHSSAVRPLVSKTLAAADPSDSRTGIR